jgi:2-amino-4-hydroxy-6-hydroxymethyldihydropteridine diphosphokinase
MQTWRPAYIGIGSNLDTPARQVEDALDELASLPETRLVGRSRLYRSAPLDGAEQPDYVNAVAALLTRLDAPALLEALHGLERARGRERGDLRWAPRVIDLDLLVYSGLSIDMPGLVVPHPGIAQRNFVLLPLRELAPDLEIPGLGRVAAIEVDECEPRIERIV